MSESKIMIRTEAAPACAGMLRPAPACATVAPACSTRKVPVTPPCAALRHIRLNFRPVRCSVPVAVRLRWPNGRSRPASGMEPQTGAVPRACCPNETTYQKPPAVIQGAGKFEQYGEFGAAAAGRRTDTAALRHLGNTPPNCARPRFPDGFGFTGESKVW
jgi:hypothetical protein